ncbi:hypothetical protein MA785_000804 [Vibrio parahaemolyticus]|nr:hypothetical protein [Vibrio parahaemolyticus]EJR2787913.1 hypothetical protein [Vibrio parahaemolyticus]
MEDITKEIRQLEQNIVALEAKRQRILQPTKFSPLRKELGAISIDEVEKRLERCYEKLEALRTMDLNSPKTV